jgi:MFS family permease
MSRPTLLADLRAVYFFYYTAVGAFFPFVNLYYAQLGLSGVQMGSLAALPALVGSTASMVLGGVADAFRWHRGLLVFAVGGTLGCVFMLSQARDFPTLLLWTILFSLLGSPIVPILDSLAVRPTAAGNRGFGQLRVWGTWGWAAATLAVGYLVGRGDLRWIFFAYMALIACTLAVSLLQPRPSPTPRPMLARDLPVLLTNRTFLLFLGSVGLLGAAIGATGQFLSLYLRDLGAGEGIIGLTWALGAVVEVPVMLGSAYLIRKLSLDGALRLAFAMFSLRWILLSYVPSVPWALGLQLLHGPSFALFLVAAVTRTGRLAPAGLGTTAQAIFGAVAFGFSSIVGALVGGHVYDTLGLRVLFRILGAAAAVGLALLWVTARRAPTGKEENA